MKKYIFEADKTQREKPTEPKYVFCAPARVAVYAETDEDAMALAREKLNKQYAGTGFLLGSVRPVQSCDSVIDWNYGYGGERGSGTAKELAALRAACTK